MIGLILKSEQSIEEWGNDWIPDPIDSQTLNEAFLEVLGYQPKQEEFCHDKGGNLIHFTIDDLDSPRSITFNCTPNEVESKIISRLSKHLNAKIYDSEMSDFVQL